MLVQRLAAGAAICCKSSAGRTATEDFLAYELSTIDTVPCSPSRRTGCVHCAPVDRAPPASERASTIRTVAAALFHLHGAG
jgi:hypothetical protein